LATKKGLKIWKFPVNPNFPNDAKYLIAQDQTAGSDLKVLFPSVVIGRRR
jgi:hypothetical protein